MQRSARPLPSDSSTTSVPVSATAKLAPEMATSASRNLRRRCSRAASASARGSSVSPSGAGTPTLSISRRKISRISARPFFELHQVAVEVGQDVVFDGRAGGA
jgi:hypothetical protein